jgi:glycosyltransferase A (GT-A) superfamily protein (DUF2064 family)
VGIRKAQPVASSKRTKAILVFSANPRKDLVHRGLSRKFSGLLQIPSLTAQVTREADVHLFTADEDGPPSRKLSGSDYASIHFQKGASFAERLNCAIDELVLSGYRQIIITGSDCPELQSSDIHTALEQLSTHRLVLGPDHQGGCYLIGLHAEDRSKLAAIQWQANTDCLELQNAFGIENTYLLKVKHDIDSLSDVRLLANCKNKWGAMARKLLQQDELRIQFQISFPIINLQTDLQRPNWQLPPPCTAGILPA